MGGLRAGTTHHGRIVATQKPQMRTIFWYDGQRQHFMFPHSQFIMYYTRNERGNNVKYWLNRLHVAFSLEPFECGNTEQRLYGLPLANYDVGLAICFYEWPSAQNPREFAERVIGQYWSSPFQDYGDCFSHWRQTYQSQQPQFANHWLAASKSRNYDWLLEQDLIQPPYLVNLKKMYESNKTLTDEIDLFPDISIRSKPLSYEEKVRALAHQKWVLAGQPNDPNVSDYFWSEAEKEIRATSQ